MWKTTWITVIVEKNIEGLSSEKVELARFYNWLDVEDEEQAEICND